MKKLLNVTLVLFVLLVNSCGYWSKKIDPTVTNSVISIDEAIDKLVNESGEWRETLTTLKDELVDDAQSTLRTEVENLIQSSANAVGRTVMCDLDFINDRIVEQLVKLKNKLLLKREGEELTPSICSVVPLGIDMTIDADRRKTLVFFGYNLRDAGFKVALTSGNSEQDITDFLTHSDDYTMTLTLAGNGIQLNDKSDNIKITWKNEEISTVPILQPALKICGASVKTIDPDKVTFQPKQTGEDADFDGNGPKVKCSVKLYIAGNSLKASVYMKAREVNGGTEAEGTKVFTIYRNTDANKRISRILTNKKDKEEYTDGDKNDDVRHHGDGDLVSSFRFVGDTDGNEAGTRTQVSINFNKIKIELVDIDNCVTQSEADQFISRDFLDPRSVQRLRSTPNNN